MLDDRENEENATYKDCCRNKNDDEDEARGRMTVQYYGFP